MTRDEIAAAIDAVLDEVAHAHGGGVLYGEGGALDSVGLLSLVVLLEERVQEATGNAIRLVNANALSSKRSPFRTADTLADYVAGLICPSH